MSCEFSALGKFTRQDEVAESLNSHYRQFTVFESMYDSAALPYITLLKHANVLTLILVISIVPTSKLYKIVEIILTS